MARGVKGTGPYSKTGKKAATKEPSVRLFKVTINEGQNDDPVFLTPALNALEAITKAATDFAARFPAVNINSLDVSLEGDSGDVPGSEYNPYFVP